MEYSEKACPTGAMSTTNPTWSNLSLNPGRLVGSRLTARVTARSVDQVSRCYVTERFRWLMKCDILHLATQSTAKVSALSPTTVKTLEEDPCMLSAEDWVVKFYMKGGSHDLLNACFRREAAYNLLASLSAEHNKSSRMCTDFWSAKLLLTSVCWNEAEFRLVDCCHMQGVSWSNMVI